MIFVTVGAYDLPFDRLVAAVDSLVAKGVFTDEVFAQIGHSAPPNGKLPFARFLSYEEMNARADDASLIITQGGPGSIMLALGRGKIPIVVPRRKAFGEMVDDHQVLFAQKLALEKKILLIDDISELKDACLRYGQRTASMEVSAHAVAEKAALFAAELEKMILVFRDTGGGARR
jgi:UDP-N-acetylglucosamine transferase subunit ALG13